MSRWIVARTVRVDKIVRVLSVWPTRREALDNCPAKPGISIYPALGAEPLVGALVQLSKDESGILRVA